MAFTRSLIVIAITSVMMLALPYAEALASDEIATPFGDSSRLGPLTAMALLAFGFIYGFFRGSLITILLGGVFSTALIIIGALEGSIGLSSISSRFDAFYSSVVTHFLLATLSLIVFGYAVAFRKVSAYMSLAVSLPSFWFHSYIHAVLGPTISIFSGLLPISLLVMLCLFIRDVTQTDEPEPNRVNTPPAPTPTQEQIQIADLLDALSQQQEAQAQVQPEPLQAEQPQAETEESPTKTRRKLALD